MTFFKNIFGRKDKAQPQQPAAPTPAPAAEAEPVAPAPAPVPPTKASDDIRRALESVTMKLIASPDAAVQDIARRLISLKPAVGDQPSTYKGFDASIAKAIGQIETFVNTCGGDYAAVNAQIDTLQAAINARFLTEESTDKFGPTMQTHYYQVMLIDLRGRLQKLEMDVAEKTIWRDHVMTLPPEKQIPHMQSLMTCNGYINAAAMQKNVLESYIANYEFAYSSALQLLSFDGELPPMDVNALFDGIISQTTQFEHSFELNQRAIVDFNTRFASQAEAQLVATAKAEASARQQQDQQKLIFDMQEAAAKNLAHLTGQPNPIVAPQAQQSAPQAQQAPAAPVAPSGEMQTL